MALGRDRPGVIVVDLFRDSPVQADNRGRVRLPLEGYGHRWLRLQPGEPLLA